MQKYVLWVVGKLRFCPFWGAFPKQPTWGAFPKSIVANVVSNLLGSNYVGATQVFLKTFVSVNQHSLNQHSVNQHSLNQHSVNQHSPNIVRPTQACPKTRTFATTLVTSEVCNHSSRCLVPPNQRCLKVSTASNMADRMSRNPRSL